MMRVLVAAMLLAPAIASAAVAGLCTPSETVFFSCVTATKKWIGLCGHESGAVQYRFGTPARIEFRFPANPADAVESIRIAHYQRFQVERLELTFINGGIRYTLFDYLEKGKQDAGMRVVSPLDKEHEILCVGRTITRLSKLRGVLHCDPDSALGLGACR